MTYPIFLLGNILAIIVSTILAPLLPMFAVMRLGKSNNGSRWAYEPRLPLWLAWFDNPDNSLWGDSAWQSTHCPSFFGCYFGMVRWLWRNKSGGFVWSVLGAKVTEPVTYNGTLGIDNEPYKPGWLTCLSGAYWQVKYVSRPISSKCITINLGWMLDTWLTSGNPPEKARFLFQPQISTIKYGKEND